MKQEDIVLIIIGIICMTYLIGRYISAKKEDKKIRRMADQTISIMERIDQKRDLIPHWRDQNNLDQIDQMLDLRNQCTQIVMQYIHRISTAQALEFFIPDKNNSGACLPLDIGKVLTVERKGYIIPNSNADDFYISDDSVKTIKARRKGYNDTI